VLKLIQVAVAVVLLVLQHHQIQQALVVLVDQESWSSVIKRNLL
jgi:hypothetical protein